MLRKLSTLSLVALLFVVGCRREPILEPDNVVTGDILKMKPNPVEVPQGDPLSQEDLDRAVIGKLEERNDFHWEWMDLRTLWSATLYNDHSVSVGYKPANAGNIDDIIHTIDISKTEWRAVHDALIDLVLTGLNDGRTRPVTAADIIIEDDPILPVITFRLTDKEIITRLYNLENVRYIEPLDYWPANDADRSTSGCSPSTYALNAADYTTITPNAKLPWNFNNHNVPAAWANSQGAGITVGVIDAGLSSAQPLIGSDFNNGDSNVGRSFSASATLGTSAYTSCSHGTSMAGQAVGPRNANGASTGVAYKSSLRFIRACEDVVLNLSSERTAVKNALLALGADPAVRVISMSIGSPFSYGVLSDGVNYAYGQGKLVMAAAGTSFDWTSWWGVIYPAAYSNCVAVTGVKENGSKCGSCHDGSQVDLTICMERSSNSSRNSLSLSPSGVTPSYIGGSSAATSTAAGIAALVWSVRPNATRAQILSCLTSTAQFANAPSGSKGYGNINAQAAVNCALAL
ncbi:MAG: S8 family serine peptidase [Flavobacteriales bacterium]|nr:S8 family serine peptidase [Flavobacteriales bacterium]